MKGLLDQIRETNIEAEKLTVSVDRYYRKLADLQMQQADLAQTGKSSTSYYQTIITLLERYKVKHDAASTSLSTANTKMLDQIKLYSESRDRAKIMGEVYDGVTSKLKNFTSGVSTVGTALKASVSSFEPLKNSISNAVSALTPFRNGLTEANKIFTNYKANLLDGQSRLQAFANSTEGTKKLFAAFDGGTASLKTLRVAIAQTGIGLLVIAVAALMEALQKCKPVMDVINGVLASMGAMFKVLGDSLIGLFTDPIGTITNFGSSMADAAKDAYELVQAQEKLKAALAGQEVVNAKLQEQIDIEKDRVANVRLGITERENALKKQYALENDFYTKNKVLADKSMANAIKDAEVKGNLHDDEVKNLKQKGTEYAQTLLATGRIDQEQFDAIKKADLELIKLRQDNSKNLKAFMETQQQLNDEQLQKDKEREEKQQQLQQQRKEARDRELAEIKEFTKEAENVRTASATRMALNLLEGYAREVQETQNHFAGLMEKYSKFVADYEAKTQSKSAKDKKYLKDHEKEYKASKATVEQLEKEKAFTLNQLTDKFRANDLKQLEQYQSDINKTSREAGKTAQKLALRQLDDEYQEKDGFIVKANADSKIRLKAYSQQQKDAREKGNQEEVDALQKKIDAENELITKGNSLKITLQNQYNIDKNKLEDSFSTEKNKATLGDEIAKAHNTGNWKTEFAKKKELLDIEFNQTITAARAKGEAEGAITREYNEKQRQLEEAKLEAQAESQKRYLKSTATLSNAIMGIFGKNTIASRLAFKAQQAAAAGQVIIDTKKAIMGIWSASAGIPFIGVPKAIAETAIVAAVGASSLASIIKQKPGFSLGGQYVSDGRGALLPGYSRTDNTNAYLRSGEAVVVSEAMRNPWARNLVSAINVAHGGRGFSTPASAHGYAMGGIFTDGGNAGRYYSQPVQDVKELANTLAYQMINNFPPVYVDVKDINTQQSIMARTVNRVNL